MNIKARRVKRNRKSIDQTTITMINRKTLQNKKVKITKKNCENRKSMKQYCINNSFVIFEIQQEWPYSVHNEADN